VTRGTEVEDSLADSRIGLFIHGTEGGRVDLLGLEVGGCHAQETTLSGQRRCTRTALGIGWSVVAGSKREPEGIEFGDRTLSGGEALGRSHMEDL
jgi:hypothetical protein